MTRVFTGETPSSTNNSDGTPGITVATAEQYAVDGTVSGIWFYATTSVGGTYTVALWDVTAADPNGSGGTLVESKTLVAPPDAGVWNFIAFDAPVAVLSTKLYKASVFSGEGRYVFSSNFFDSPLTNGDVTAPANGSNPIGLGAVLNGSFTINAAMQYPTTQPGGASCYFVASEFVADSGTTPVTSTLDVRWRVANQVTSTVEARWRVANLVTSTLDIRWRVYNSVTSVLEARWRVYSLVSSTLQASWRVANRVTSFLTALWRVTPDVAPVTPNSAILDAQRAATLAYIAYDPTNIDLIPVSRVATAGGGFTEVDGEARAVQTVKLILLAYDQRPTLTLAGVERVIDYHLLGRWDMTIAVGDYWIDGEGTRWDVVGFSEGWDYMTKAFVSRHVPRNARP